jgi:hypothetical protein
MTGAAFLPTLLNLATTLVHLSPFQAAVLQLHILTFCVGH